MKFLPAAKRADLRTNRASPALEVERIPWIVDNRPCGIAGYLVGS
jgi:hypothetical protein